MLTWFKSKQKPKPDAITELEKRIGKKLIEVPLSEIMPAINGYALDKNGEVTGLNLLAANISDLSFLEAFPRLTHLHLGSNRITDLSPLAGLTALKELLLYNNKIIDLPPLAGLTALTKLYLQENQINDLSPLAGLTALTELNLEYNKITDLSPLARLTALTDLDLSSNQIADLSPLAPLTALTNLDLSSNKLTDISPLALLTSLAQLDLSSNKLIDISPLAPLTALTNLDLSSNKLTDITPLARLTVLKKLYLQENQINDLPPLARLTALKELYLTKNKLIDISPLAHLKNLTHLYMNNNQITDILPLTILMTSGMLRALDLSKNKITHLPEACTKYFICINLDDTVILPVIYIEGNPLETPPIEVVKQGTKAVRNYFKELKEKESVPLLQCKLLIVGNGEVGKTTLMKKLMDNSFKVEPGQEESTHGIHIQPWKLHVPFPDTGSEPGKENENEPVNLVFWDFGGQDIYHSTHQFFLTKRSLYLFVWEARKEEETRSFDYWLNIVKLLSAGSPVIIAMNKADLRSKFIDEAAFKTKFPDIRTFCKISCLTGQGIEELTQIIRSNLSLMPHLHDKLPGVWVQIRQRLQELKKKKNYIPQEEYQSICREFGLNRERAQFLSDYLHDLGVILHYRTDPMLQHTVILNPEWATEAVYKLIDTREIMDNCGSFYLEDLNRYWDPQKYPHDKHRELVRLMEKFELCFNFYGTDLYFVPELQPPKDSSDPFCKTGPTPPKTFDKSDKQKLLEVPEPFLEKVPGLRTLRFNYHYDFMPEGIVSRFMARMFYLILEKKRFWKNRVELKFEDSFALVAGEPLNRRASITITGKNQRDLLAIIRSHFDAIHSTLNMEKNRHYHEMIPCICSKCLETEEPYFYPYEKLEGALEKNITHVTCFESYEQVSIHDLLARIVLPGPRPSLTDSLITSLSQLQGLSGTIHDDEDSRNGFIALLLGKDGHRVKDQTRWGRSASGNSMGEIDIKIENQEGKTISLIEALKLDYLNRNYIKDHVTKIFDYDLNGLPYNFILVYAEAPGFQKLWQSYLEYIPQIEYKYKALGNPETEDTPFAEIKLARTKHSRQGKEVALVHIFVNMVPGK